MSAENSAPLPPYLKPRAITDVATAWDARVQQVTSRGGVVLALRGAGSVNGIDPQAADHAVSDVLVPEIIEASQRGPVAVMYDGDPDNPSKPDIGAVYGRLQDRFAGSDDVSFLVAQVSGWYYPPEPGACLENAYGLPAETFVFEPNTYEGDHNRFTQSPDLVAYPGYRQVYVGPAGQIATGQMVDYLERAGTNPTRITVVRTLLNEALDAEIAAKLAAAKTDADKAKFARQLEQRQALYGAHWLNDGSFNRAALQEVPVPDDHELMVVWTRPDCVDVLNCRTIDLYAPEFDQQFAEADYFVKTRPIQARRIAEGMSEDIIVGSGATRDTARGGDWVCRSISGEEYVVHAQDFGTLYDADPDNAGWFIPRPEPRKLVRVDEDVVFVAPWGEKQVVQRGGYLMERSIESGPRAGQIERYGIAQKDVVGDFVPYNGQQALTIRY